MTEHPKPRPPGDKVPKYYALKQELLKRIESLEPGNALPAERVLSVLYSTSRTTVRQAVQALIVEGRLQRLHGSGTFVTRPKLAQVLQLTSYTEDMRLLGLEPSSHLLQVGEIRANAMLAERLGVVVGERVHRVERLRMANGEPMAIETTHLAARRYPQLRQHLGGLGSLYQLLDQVYGVRLKEAEETIETVLARPHEAALLGTDVGVPMLLLSRHSFDEEGQPVEYVKSIYRGDRYKFVAWLRKSGHGEERPKNLRSEAFVVGPAPSPRSSARTAQATSTT